MRIPWHVYGYQIITFGGWFSFTVGSRAQIQVFRVVWQVLSAEPSHWPGSSISYWCRDYRHAPPYLEIGLGFGSCETIMSPSQLAPSGPLFIYFLASSLPFCSNTIRPKLWPVPCCQQWARRLSGLQVSHLSLAFPPRLVILP